jgi:hypothetical protein
MNRMPMSGAPPIDDDEARLQQIDTLIAQAREAERAEAARKAEEARQRAEREVQAPAYTLGDLERLRGELANQIALRQTHLQAAAERELTRRRADSLRADIVELQDRLAVAQAELTTMDARLAT